MPSGKHRVTFGQAAEIALPSTGGEIAILKAED
jgi:hypothetical protein